MDDPDSVVLVFAVPVLVLPVLVSIVPVFEDPSS